MDRTARTAIAALVLGLLFLSAPACRKPEASAPEAGGPLVMKAFRVPLGQGQRIENSLNHMFATGEDQRIGRAALAPNGDLLVAAPAGFLPGLESYFRRLEAAGPTLPATVSVECWILLSEPAVGPVDLGAFGDLRPTLQAITESRGPQRFLLLERLQAATMIGNQVGLSGAVAHAKIMPFELSGGDCTLWLSLDVMGLSTGTLNQFESRIRLPEGKTVVIGESGVRVSNRFPEILDWLQAGGGKGAPGDSPEQASIYYVVRAKKSA